MSNNNRVPPPSSGTHALAMLGHFDHQLSEKPEAGALSFAGNTYSYGDLSRAALKFARALAAEGVEPGDKVAIGISRSEALLPLLLAVWSLRAAYIPVDPSYPSSRQAYILADAGVRLLICDAPPVELDFVGRAVTLAALCAEAGPVVPGPLAPQAWSPDDLAYIIYTSGSTGNPKGVAITQGNVGNFLLGMLERPGLSPDDRLLAVTTISFDIHVLELFLPMMIGARVVLASKEESVSPPALQALIDDGDITVLQATPATWSMLLGQGWKPKRPLKALVGGEALPKNLQPLIYEASSELWNMYGPTETTVWSCCHRIDSADGPSFIGRPIRNTTVFVVDEELQPVPAGTSGELLIGGDGVAQGYFGKPELTQMRFLTLPQLQTAGRVYRTGDRVILHEGGVLQYLDRIDNQIKIRGFRIEPLEIERTLEQHPSITQAVVVAANFPGGDKRLTAFYLGQAAASDRLQEHCAARLPPHMLPQHLIHIHHFPMTANNKVDRNQLAAMAPDEVLRQRTEVSQQPRDDLDRSMIGVWEAALGVRGVGLDDNFFNLGGHSLLALQVVQEMSRATGVSFAPTALFETPTIRALRESVGEQAGKTASVVRLNTQVVGEPLFCLCGVEIYQSLADQFKNRRPVFGVFAREEIAFIEAQQQGGPMEYCLDKLVSSYADAIRRQGPYPRVALVGLSFGGLVALEVAKRFRKEGIEVSSVILLDTYLSFSARRSISKLASDLASVMHREGWLGVVKSWFSQVERKALVQDVEKAPLSSVPSAQRRREQAFDQATRVYEKEGAHYDFDVLLIKAKFMDFGFGYRGRRDYGLGPFIKGKLTVKTVKSDHLGLVKGDAVAEVHALISAYEARKV